ncbi:MAG: hypothetical protein K2Y71_22885 [Xanthobacteraceae bacterium]|nr:hypothetical protein [Xanthobacteraceae bacterium]
MMKKVLMSLAAAMIMVAGFATSADAQRGRGGGPGVVRVGGPGFVGVRGGFVGAPGFRRAAFVGGPGWVGGRRWVGGPGWYGGRRWVGGPGWRYRRLGWGVPVVAAGWYGGYGGCMRWRPVATPWGPQWRLVNICYAPVGFYGYGYPVRFYGGIY